MPRFTAVALAGLLGGCFSPLISDGTVVCGTGGLCPDGLTCGLDNRCHRDTTGVGGGDGTSGDTAAGDVGRGDDAGGDAQPGDIGPRVSDFVATPDAFVAGGLDAGWPETLTFVATISQLDGLDVEAFTATPADNWAGVMLDAADTTAVVATITVDTTGLMAGVQSTTIAVTADQGTSAGTTITIELTLADWEHVHAGPAAGRCPHTDMLGMPVSTCDFTGPTALIDAALAAVSGQRILVHDDGGTPATYDGNIELAVGTRLGGVPGVPIDNVRVTKDPMQADMDALVFLRGDGVHLERLTLLVNRNSQHGISSWPVEDDPTGATSGHLLENLVLFGITPEQVGSNSVQRAFQIGTDTTVRNSHIYGYFEAPLETATAHRSQLIGNTFIYFQEINAGAPAIDAAGTVDLTVENNVWLALNPTPLPLVQASAASSGLSVTGNVIEGFGSATSVATGTNSTVTGNTVGPAPLDTPLHAHLAADASPSLRVQNGGGRSLDGHWGGTWPGAFQSTSAALATRPPTVTVGDSDCGGSPCDFPTTLANEMQWAAWSGWPGTTVEVYPTAAPIAGDAMISWEVSIRGMGAAPGDVTLVNRPENSLWDAGNVWDRHDAVVSLQRHVRGAVSFENFRIEVSDPADRAAMFISSGDDPEHRPSAWRTIRRLLLNSGTVAAGGIDTGLHLGDRVLVTDTLIAGQFRSCVRFGHRSLNSPSQPTSSTTGRVINTTCRLTGTGPASAVGAFEVAAVTGTVLGNVVVEQAVAAPAFIAQRRSSGDMGVTALDVPASFSASAFSIRGLTTNFDGFASGDGSYTVTLDAVGAMDPLFIGPFDSHLDMGAAAMDSGVDPATLSPELGPGTDLDGVDRNGRMIDRGAYEQGL